VKEPNVLTTDMSVTAIDYQCNHVRVIRSYFNENFRILVRGGEDLVFDQNVFNGTGAYSITPATNGSVRYKDFKITNNLFLNFGYIVNRNGQYPRWATIYIEAYDGDGRDLRNADRPVQNLTIEGNTFIRNDGVELGILAAKNVKIKNNLFVNTHNQEPNKYTAPFLDNKDFATFDESVLSGVLVNNEKVFQNKKFNKDIYDINIGNYSMQLVTNLMDNPQVIEEAEQSNMTVLDYVDAILDKNKENIALTFYSDLKEIVKNPEL